MTHPTEPRAEVTQAKADASVLRWHDPIPVRVYKDAEGRVIWSKVDADAVTDLTPENSDGMLYHVRPLFVPHGAANPLNTRTAAEAANREEVEPERSAVVSYLNRAADVADGLAEKAQTEAIAAMFRAIRNAFVGLGKLIADGDHLRARAAISPTEEEGPQ